MGLVVLAVDPHTNTRHLQPCKGLWSCPAYFYRHMQDKRSSAETIQQLQTVQTLLPHRCAFHPTHQNSPSSGLKLWPCRSQLSTWLLNSAGARSLPRCSSFALTSPCTLGSYCHFVVLPFTRFIPFLLPARQTTISGKQRKRQRMLAGILARWCFHTSGTVLWLVQSFWGILCPHSWQQLASQNPSHKIAGKSILLSLFFDCVAGTDYSSSCVLCAGYSYAKISI